MPTIREMSTVGVEPTRRLEYWREGARAIGGMHPIVADADRFEGCAKVSLFETLKFGRLAVSQNEARWTRDLIRQTDDTFLRLLLQCRGSAEIEQGDARFILHPGEWTLLHASQPHVIRCSERIEELVVIVPGSGIAPRLLDAAQRLKGVHPVDGDVSGIFFRFARSILDDLSANSSTSDSHVDRAGLTLITAMLEDCLEGQARTTCREMWVERVRTYIDHRLNDPNLSVQRVADALGVSKRYIHSLFEGGQSVHSYIWDSRLQRCAKDLMRREMTGRSITTIALSCGFSCPAHFSKLFKARYGISPRDFRKRSLDS